MPHLFDVPVIGGGSAGVTTAGFLAEQGHDVVGLEREKLPRYSIDESLVPGLRPVPGRLRLFDQCEGFVKLISGLGDSRRIGFADPYPPVSADELRFALIHH